MLTCAPWGAGFILPALIAAALAVPMRAQDDLPDGKGRETLENTCTECHGLDRILKQLRTSQQWRLIASQMRSKGATMSDSEFNTLVEYLSQNFGIVEPKPKSEPDGNAAKKINVNTASARELESGLQLRPRDAAAIVRHRESKGAFQEWRDLLKVQGVDRRRIEAIKERVVF